MIPILPASSSAAPARGGHTVPTHAGSCLALFTSSAWPSPTAAGVVAAGMTGTWFSAALQNVWVPAACAGIRGAVLVDVRLYECSRPFCKAGCRRGQPPWGGSIPASLRWARSALIVGSLRRRCAARRRAALHRLDWRRGAAASALFVMALGIWRAAAVGLSAGSVLPHTGPWMESVKQAFGVILLATAVWMISPVIPVVAVAAVGVAVDRAGDLFCMRLIRLPAHARAGNVSGKASASPCTVVAGARVVGALAGAKDLLQPLAGLRAAVSRPKPARCPSRA